MKRTQPKNPRTWSEHDHYVDCYRNDDDMEVVYCTSCGEEW